MNMGFHIRSSLGWLLYRLQRQIPNLRGKQWLLRFFTSVVGALPLKTKDGIWLETLLTSSMDLSYLDPAGGGHDLIRAEINRLKPGDVVVDIGANTGYLALLASRQVGATGCVLCFEPSQREFVRLLQNVRRNHANNLYALNLAASDRPGLQALPVCDSHTGTNSFHVADAAGHDCQEVVVMPLAALLLDLKFSDIALLKLDVEGHEWQVLLGLQPLLETGAVQRVVVEITEAFQAGSSGNAARIYALMGSLGYQPRFGLQNLWHYDEIFSLSGRS